MSGSRRALVAARTSLTITAVLWLTTTLWRMLRGPLLLPVHTFVENGPTGLDRLRLDQLVVALCAAAVLACCAWLLLVVLLLVAQTLSPADAARPGLVERAASRITPPALRRALLLACGLALTAGITSGPAAAEGNQAGVPGPGGDPARHAVTATATAGLEGLQLPDRPVGRALSPPGVIVVAAGDSLWSLAERALPAGAGDAEVTAAWHELYRANAALIGPDPDLILPGMRLQAPATFTVQREEHR